MGLPGRAYGGKFMEKSQVRERAKQTESPTDSHSEKEILKGCILLMQSLMGRFEEYLEYMDIAPEIEEERFCTTFTYGEIVQRLFLWTTHHSGGTSTWLKCEKLGVDYGKSVVFEDERGKDEAET